MIEAVDIDNLKEQIMKCRSMASLEKLHDALCRRYPVWERKLFLQFISEKESELMQACYWEKI